MARAAPLFLTALFSAALVAQQPGAADPQQQLSLATSLYEQARYLDAMHAFAAATLADDPSVVVRARKGKIRAALHIAEFTVAVDEAERLHAEAPDDAEAMAVRGDALWARGLFDEAEAAYSAASARDPQLARARYGRARSLASRSQLGAALSAALAALALAPRDPDIHALAATVYERMNRFADAAREYASYADLVPPGEASAIETSRARAAFLTSFGNRVPIEAVSTGDRNRPIPFKLVKNKVVVQGRVNGSRVDWVVDTGAERTGISADTAARANVHAVTSTLTAGVGAPRLRRIQLARADTIDIGPIRLRNVPVSIRDAARGGAARWQGESLSPLALGLSVVVDYDRRQLVFGPTTVDEQATAFRLPLRVLRLPLVRGVLNARHPAYFVVDTGGELISISAETAESLEMRPVRRIPLRVFGLSGIDEGAFLLPGIDLDFDDIAYRKVGLAVLNLRAPSVLLGFQLGGIVGHQLLGGYRVSLDLERGEVRLSPSSK